MKKAQTFLQLTCWLWECRSCDWIWARRTKNFPRKFLHSSCSNPIAAPAFSEPLYPGAQETICGSEVVSFCHVFSLHLHRVFAQIDETSGYADNTASCSDFFRCPRQRGEKCVGQSPVFSRNWWILDDFKWPTAPRAPTCTDIPYQHDCKDLLVESNSGGMVELGLFHWSTPRFHEPRRSRPHRQYSQCSLFIRSPLGSRYLMIFDDFFPLLLIEWRGNWWFKAGQSESWNGSTQPPSKPNDPRWGPWRMRHKRHLFDG